MKIWLPDDIKIYIACGKTDMRKSIDGLSAIISQNFNLDPFENSLFLFCRGKRDRMKALLWEGDGFLLFYLTLHSTRRKIKAILHDVEIREGVNWI